MIQLVFALGAVVAVAAAIRGTWSPCGLSMLSTITPIGERGRDHRFAATAAWFIAGGVVGGALLGSLAALLAVGISALGLSATATLGLVAVLALGAAALDHGMGPLSLPHHRRQVNELWLNKYRSWVYGMGFGVQIGSGLATFIMTAAVYLTIAIAALTANPLAALALGMLFGLVRGLGVLLGARITDADALLAFHRRFDALGPVVRRAVIGVELGVAFVAGVAAFGLVPALAGAVVVAVVAAGLLVGGRLPKRAPALGERATVAG